MAETALNCIPGIGIVSTVSDDKVINNINL